MPDHRPIPETSPRRVFKPGAEVLATLAGTGLAAIWLILTAVHSGPLWRDEVNTVNVARMPSLQELWRNLPFESFPPLWPLLVRGGAALGLIGGDLSVRMLGLCVALFFLGCLWLSARWIGCRAPSLSIGLLGCLPAVVFILGSNRAYGLGCCLLVLSFGTLWRLVELPSRGRMLIAGATSLLFAQCVYYDLIFLAAMLTGAALVALRRRAWKLLAALTAIGAVCAGSLLIYVPVIRHGTPYVPMMQWPFFDAATLCHRIGDAVAFRSSADLGPTHHVVWIWIGIVVLGIVAAAAAGRRKNFSSSPSSPAADVRGDFALFGVTSLLLGIFGMLVFLLRLHYFTQTWYYVELACLCAISLDGLLGANWPAWRPGEFFRLGFMLVMLGLGAKSAWAEAHTRKSNVDSIALVLNKNAAADDLIIVESAFEGITFGRYYHGAAPWVTVPPIDSHKVHRNDLVFEKMHDPAAMMPVLTALTNTLRDGHAVWLVGSVTARKATPPGPNEPRQWVGTYLFYWNAQVSSVLLLHAVGEPVLGAGETRVSCLEDLPLVRFAGYHGLNETTNSHFVGQ